MKLYTYEVEFLKATAVSSNFDYRKQIAGYLSHGWRVTTSWSQGHEVVLLLARRRWFWQKRET
jgi:hypothetical protein